MSRARTPIQYHNTLQGVIVQRVDQLTAEVLVDGVSYPAHIRNHARMEDLIVPKAKVTMQKSGNTYNLISVYRPRIRWINVDGLAPRKLVKMELKWVKTIEEDDTVGGASFDLYGENEERKYLYNVEGCTLIPPGKSYYALFPDETTNRSIKRLFMKFSSAAT